MKTTISLNDKYALKEGRIFLNGTQALVRLPMAQMHRDRAAGHNTACFISGYRGSPIGAYDQQLLAARKHLDPLNITFQPGLNEELAATAVWGSQQLSTLQDASVDGVTGFWYGKGPGVDRSGDVFKHANAAGTSPLGGVLAIAGDDHTCKSSSIPHQSDHAFMSALMPMLYPSSVQEFIEMGLLGIAMSRYAGVWVGFKVISETIETSAVIDLAQEQTQFILPQDVELPADGLQLRWPDAPVVQDDRLQEHKGYAAIAFARANKVDRVTRESPRARLGIVASGKAYEDVLQALRELGIDREVFEEIGLRLYKVRMPWPLEPEGIRQFSKGLEEVFIVEERREIIENQIKQQLFNWRADVRPRIVGKFDEDDNHFLPLSQGLTVGSVASALAKRIGKLDLPEGLLNRMHERLEAIERRQRSADHHQPPVVRTPYFCAGCPHNTSTKVPSGSKALAGIGCHYMVQWMDRDTDTFTQMGGEGVTWSALGRYAKSVHRFVNLGDGTYFHSGLLAIRQSVAADANITYKILYNDAVAMTGGQTVDGELSPRQITHQLYHEKVKKIALVSDTPEAYSSGELAPGVSVHHRDQLADVQHTMRDTAGTTAIVYVQTCAAEKRRRRKRGLMADPDQRLYINPAVCEGCGDCLMQSNCVAIEPLETIWGRKRKINQSSCNKDFSCQKGFCPSFVTVRGATPRKMDGRKAPDTAAYPTPELPSLAEPYNLVITGVGGTGVLTMGALLGMAAHIEGKRPLILDMAGLAQKGGAVVTHVRIGTDEAVPTAPRISPGKANVLLAADSVVAASKEGVGLCDPAFTQGVVNTHVAPVADFVRKRDFDFHQQQVEKTVASDVVHDRFFINFTGLARQLIGDEMASNIMLMGYAWQQGLVPLAYESLVEAITLNRVAVEQNLQAFNWGRALACEEGLLVSLQAPTSTEAETLSYTSLVSQRCELLTNYQNAAWAARYEQSMQRLEQAVEARVDDQAKAQLLQVAATQLAKLMSYKDEYEVARLYASPEFRKGLEETFEGDYRIAFNLAPPMLPGVDTDGRPKKREFGPWMLRCFSWLAPWKRLRGSALDPFGYTNERRQERTWIERYEDDMDCVASKLTQDNWQDALKLLALPEGIRGFGPVKQEAMDKAEALRESYRNALNVRVVELKQSA